MASLHPLTLLFSVIVVFAPTSNPPPGVLSVVAAAIGPQVYVSGLEDAEKAHFLESVAEDVISRVPGTLVAGAGAGSRIAIHVQPLNEELNPADFCVDAGRIFGEFDRRRHRIVVSSRLVDLAWANREAVGDDFDCMHRSFGQTLRATIVHELGHMYDESVGASQGREFSNIAGGQKRWIPFRRNRVKNYNAASSPDPYEFADLAEAFAVNLEYYVLDARYRCARPGWSSYFDEEFGIRPDPDEEHDACADYRSLLLSSQVATDNLKRAVDLDADRIFAIHYLHAAAGAGIASRWGHAMFRVVMCAPWQELGEECLEDTADDIVLSYRANVADITLNYISGLFGAYPSQLFVYELPEILKEYNRQEFRDLISVPLELTEAEVRRFVAVTLDRFWSYEGKYYFFWNHCGTETLTHLGAVLPPDVVDAVNRRSPRSLMRTLPRSGMTDADEYERIVAGASRGVHFFPSKEAEYEATFADLQQYVLYPFESFAEFLDKTRVEDRAGMYDGFFGTSEYAAAPTAKRAAVVAGILHMERLLQVRAMKGISDEFVRLLRQGDEAVEDSVRTAFGRLFGQPWELVDDGRYGVPARADVERYLSRANADAALDDWIDRFLRDYPAFGTLRKRLVELRGLEQTLTRELARSF